LGVAAGAARRTDAARWPLGRRRGTAGPRLRRALPRFSAQTDVSDPRGHAFQHQLCACAGASLGGRARSGPARADRGACARLVPGRSRLPGVGAGRGRVSLASAGRGAADEPGARPRCLR
ncbi:hypothetical protein LTR94_033907, partial [Friedmanniomyces endolithicus]